MTYQGERARALTPEDANEEGQLFEVSKVRLGADGHVSDVLWREINTASNLDVSAAVVVPVADVVDALLDGARVAARFAISDANLPDRLFRIFEHESGKTCIVLDEPPSPGRNLTDITSLDFGS